MANLKVIPGVSKGAIYVVIAEDDDMMVAIKPEVGMVYFDDMRRFFQIGFRIHVRPQPGKTLQIKSIVEKQLNLGYLAEREDNDRYVGQCRIPACNLTLSPWVVQEHIVQDHLIERLVEGLFSQLKDSGLNLIVTEENLCEAARERFLDMVPDNKVPLPEVKVYFGKESYYPPDGPGKVPAPDADSL